MSRLCLAAIVLVLAVGCADPLQQGGVIVLPGATERLILAMRMGYAGMGDIKPPAMVRRVATEDDLIEGPESSAKIGDVRLENQSIAAVVAQIGGPRGGNLVDLARKTGGHQDELGGTVTIVDGAVVRYETLKTGTDDATNAAFVQVTGHVPSHPELLVSTRYDVAPELDTVLIHTSLSVSGELVGPIAVGDRLDVPGHVTWASKPGFVAALGKTSGYALKPLVDVEAVPLAALVSTSAPEGSSIGLAPANVTPGTFVYSRMVAPLDRPDSLALAAALAAGDGQELGEVELSLTAQSFASARSFCSGKFVLARGPNPDDRLELVTNCPLRLGDTVSAKLPAGRYEVTFEGAGYRSRGSATFQVKPKQLATASVDAVAIATGP